MVTRVPLGAASMQTRKEGPASTAECWILHEKARQHHWNGVGRLSIKTFFGGEAYYRVGRRHHAVDQTSYLLLNEGQHYAIDIASRQPVESFCIFFAPELVADVQRNLSHRSTHLLDEPEPTGRAVRFFEKNYLHDRILSPAVFDLRATHQNRAAGSILESLHGIAERLLKVHSNTLRETERLASVRPATREELYRRVCDARDHAYAAFSEPLTLGDLARTACLSPNHLLRTFRQAFGETPHQFLTTRRLEAARRLLARSELSVTEICSAVGFESLGSFSTLFRKRFGIPPSVYRQSKR